MPVYTWLERKKWKNEWYMKKYGRKKLYLNALNSNPTWPAFLSSKNFYYMILSHPSPLTKGEGEGANTMIYP